MEIRKTTVQDTLATLMARLGTAQGAEATGRQELSATNLTVSEGSGQTVTLGGDRRAAAAQLEKKAKQAMLVCQKVLAFLEKEILGAGTDAAKTPAPTASSTPEEAAAVSLLFDIYQMLALLAEVAQKQRDSARELRQAENVMIQVSIQQQADEQRAAAQLGLTLGIISAVVSTAMCAVSISMTVKSSIKQDAALKTQGIAQAQSELKTAQQAQAKIEQAQTKFDTVAQKVESSVTQAGGTMNDFKGRLENNMVESTGARAVLETRQDVLAAAKTDLAAAKAELAAARAEVAAAPEGATPEMQARVQTAEQTVAAETERVGICEAAVAEAQDRYLTSLQTDVAGLEAQVATAQGEAKADLQMQLEYAQALSAREQLVIPDGGQASAQMEMARVKLETVEEHLKTDADFLSSSRLATAAQNITQVNQTLTNLLSATGQSLHDIRMADATAIGAETQKHEQELSEIEDLFQQCQSVIDAALEALQVVQQKESEATETIIQA